jgi:hypothetical protein
MKDPPASHTDRFFYIQKHQHTLLCAGVGYSGVSIKWHRVYVARVLMLFVAPVANYSYILAHH